MIAAPALNQLAVHMSLWEDHTEPKLLMILQKTYMHNHFYALVLH